jgi:hypothetical protein
MFDIPVSSQFSLQRLKRSHGDCGLSCDLLYLDSSMWRNHADMMVSFGDVLTRFCECAPFTVQCLSGLQKSSMQTS